MNESAPKVQDTVDEFVIMKNSASELRSASSDHPAKLATPAAGFRGYIESTDDILYRQNSTPAASKDISDRKTVGDLDTAYTLNQAKLVEDAFNEFYMQKEKDQKEESKERKEVQAVIGYVWVRFPTKTRWERLYIRVNAS